MLVLLTNELAQIESAIRINQFDLEQCVTEAQRLKVRRQIDRLELKQQQLRYKLAQLGT